MHPVADDYVLVVEDDPDMRESMESVLAYAGHSIATVADGAAAATADKPVSTTKPRSRRGNGNSNQGSLFEG